MSRFRNGKQHVIDVPIKQIESRRGGYKENELLKEDKVNVVCDLYHKITEVLFECNVSQETLL